MIKEIIASVLLTTSIGTPIVQKQNDSIYNTALQGSYCLREDVEYSFTADVLIGYSYYTYSFNNSSTDIYCYIYNKYDYSNKYSVSMYIDSSSSNLFSINMHDNQSGTDTIYSISPGFDWTDVDTYFPYFIISFDNPYYISANDYSVWSSIFTKQGNVHCPVYTGWYTFANQPNFTGIDLYCNIYGNLIFNNNLYNQLNFGTGEGNHIGAEYYNPVTNANDSMSAYLGGWQPNIKVRNVYFTNVMIPIRYKNFLSQLGTFDYVVQPVQYDFGQMIFSVVDAPIYMLTQLFSFELFGIQLYVAFMGVVTLLLIMFLVRKMI